MSTKAQTEHPTQGSLFEDDYLLRTLGDVVRLPDVALGELVANAWDAGAAKRCRSRTMAAGSPQRRSGNGG